MTQPFHVVYEDNHLWVVSKASGVLVQGDATGDKPLVELGKAFLKKKYNKPGNVFLGVVHRLDRPVSGLVVLAKTSKALERMNKLFSSRKVHKVYWAIVKRKPPEEQAKLVHYLKKDSSKNITKAYKEEKPDTQRAELSYRILGRLNDHYLLEVRPITGRPHQIRVQLASIGCPIRGDVKYGFSKVNPDASIHLHARELYFTHPVTQESMRLIAPLPETEFWEQYLTLDPGKIKDKDIEKLI